MFGLLPLKQISGLLIDTNLLVLFIVGSVNRNRIDNFKRTSKYSRDDFDLLLRIIRGFESLKKPLYTVTQVITEVSNLTDLPGPERSRARQVLKSTVEILNEPAISSATASQGANYGRLGITDSAIAVVGRQNKCAVLTDDLDLYHALTIDGTEALNFTHLQAREWGLQNSI